MYICQICKKKPATIHLTDIHNNVKKEVHLCEACATEKGFNFQTTANLPHLLGLAAKKAQAQALHGAAAAKPAVTPADDPVCPHCGTRWSQFSERGRLGCAHDYTVFDAQMKGLIGGQIAPHVAGEATLHYGKVPGPRKVEDEVGASLRSLEKRLRQAVAEENYETAARLKAEMDALRRQSAPADTPDPQGTGTNE